MTSIEWLINQIHKKQYGDYPNLTFENIFKEAEEMHKQEIIDAWSDGAYGGGQFTTTHETSETYYQETFVSKGSDSEIPNVCSSQTEVNETDNTPKEVKKDSFGEISDEEIEKAAREYTFNEYQKVIDYENYDTYNDWINGAKWYREQLKTKK